MLALPEPCCNLAVVIIPVDPELPEEGRPHAEREHLERILPLPAVRPAVPTSGRRPALQPVSGETATPPSPSPFLHSAGGGTTDIIVCGALRV